MTLTVPQGAHLIGGDWSTDAPGGTAVSQNPARPDEPVGEYPLGDSGTASRSLIHISEPTRRYASSYGVVCSITNKAGIGAASSARIRETLE